MPESRFKEKISQTRAWKLALPAPAFIILITVPGSLIINGNLDYLPVGLIIALFVWFYILIAIKFFKEQIRQRSEKLQKLFDESMDVIFIIAPGSETILNVNHAVEPVLGYKAQELIGETFTELLPPDPKKILKNPLVNLRFHNSSIEVPGLLRNDGTVCPMEVTLTFIAWGKENALLATYRDITDRKKAEKHIAHMAFHDTLTGLPNRVLFKDRLKQAIIQAERHVRRVAVMYLDLDRFKTINDTLGHNTGDLLIKAVGQRLKKCLRKDDTVARIGGDEFNIVLTDMSHDEDVAKVANNIITRFSEPFEIENRELFVTTSIGISLYPLDSKNLNHLLKFADMAMYLAKDEGKNTYRLYTESLNSEISRRMELDMYLRQAMDRKELKIFYQLQVDTRTSKIVGMEALLRWEHPTEGMISPMEFIPLAEESGLIVPLGEWVFKKVCEDYKAFRAVSHNDLKIGVNVSPRQFQEADLDIRIANIIQDSGLHPDFIEIEITESLVLHDPDMAQRILVKLASLGMRISIDDFGTGYSSLAYLKKFPINILKIDRIFMQGVPGDQNDSAIVRAIIALAKSLGLTVIAEGVEDRDQVAFLKDLGCDTIQGFYFCRPLPADRILSLLSNETLSPAGEPSLS